MTIPPELGVVRWVIQRANATSLIATLELPASIAMSRYMDVWSVDHAAAFAVTARRPHLLVTTRNSEVLVGFEADEHRVDVISLAGAF